LETLAAAEAAGWPKESPARKSCCHPQVIASAAQHRSGVSRSAEVRRAGGSCRALPTQLPHVGLHWPAPTWPGSTDANSAQMRTALRSASHLQALGFNELPILFWHCFGHRVKFLHDHVDPGVFAPDAVRTLIAAFDGAWQSISASGTKLSGPHREATREILAKYIIEQARQGELDERRLRDGALLHLTQSNLRRPPSHRK
jgi:hypothetical protein